MATYCNQHWLLSHIRNSFISTDDTGMCETVMLSDDLPKHYLRKFQSEPSQMQQHRKSLGNTSNTTKGSLQNSQIDAPLQEIDYICYPGLDQSDDEDMDLSTQSFDIQMYPEVGAHRFRSNTAQKLEKMDIARRKAARTKSVNFEDEIVPPESKDFFVKKVVTPQKKNVLPADAESGSGGVKSKLAMQLANSPKQVQNKFMEYARFDGTSLTGIQTKRINVFLSMLPESARNYPIKICVLAYAKIIEVIGLVCYKATIQYPDIPLKSIRHYALYMTEDNDDMEDFPPLDNREPCSKFGFSHLTLAERRPLASVTPIDYHKNLPSKSMTSEEDKSRLAAAAVRALQGSEQNGGNDEVDSASATADDYDERMHNHNDMLEAPTYRSFHVSFIDKRFFRTDVTLSISGERIEIDQHKNAKFWSKQKAVTYPMDAIAFCEIVERRSAKATLRIWLKASSASSAASSTGAFASSKAGGEAKSMSISSSTAVVAPHSPSSPGQYPSHASPFSFLSSSTGCAGGQPHMRFKHFDFETDVATAEQILNKLNCIMRVRSSEVRHEFLSMRVRKMEKHSKKHLKM